MLGGLGSISRFEQRKAHRKWANRHAGQLFGGGRRIIQDSIIAQCISRYQFVFRKWRRADLEAGSQKMQLDDSIFDAGFFYSLSNFGQLLSTSAISRA